MSPLFPSPILHSSPPFFPAFLHKYRSFASGKFHDLKVSFYPLIMYSQTRINVVICQDGKELTNQIGFF
jgi:hypothetical protein